MVLVLLLLLLLVLALALALCMPSCCRDCSRQVAEKVAVRCNVCCTLFHGSCLCADDLCPVCAEPHGVLYICTGFLSWIICNKEELNDYCEFLKKRAHFVAELARVITNDKERRVRIAFDIVPGKTICISMKPNGIFNLALEFEVLRERLLEF